MEIKLDGKAYRTKKIKAAYVREAFELIEYVGERVDLEKLDRMIDFVVQLYDEQFTSEDVYNGLEADALYPTLFGIIIGLTNGITEKLESKNVQPEAAPKS